VIVNDFDVLGTGLSPPEADSVLVIDPDRVLADPIAFQLLEPKSRQRQGAQRHRCMQLIHRLSGPAVQLARQRLAGHLGADSVVDVLGTAILEREYQVVELPGDEVLTLHGKCNTTLAF